MRPPVVSRARDCACFSVRDMDSDVQGVADSRLALSGAVLTGIAAISALGGAAVLWAGRRGAGSNTKIAVVATIFTGVFLLFVAYGVGSGGTQPASTPESLNNS